MDEKAIHLALCSALVVLALGPWVFTEPQQVPAPAKSSAKSLAEIDYIGNKIILYDPGEVG